MHSEMEGAILSHAKTLQDLAEQVQRWAAALTQLTADVQELQYLWSEEIMRQAAGRPGEVVAELGAGWRIERRPCVLPTVAPTSPNLDATTTDEQSDSCQGR